MRLSRNEIGNYGEKVAKRYLQGRGWKILYQNYTAPKGGEVDIVARGGDENNLLVFIEVKTRTRKGYGRPLDSVDASKRELIERGANGWLKELQRRDVPWRFDVVEVILEEGNLPEVTLIENAF